MRILISSTGCGYEFDSLIKEYSELMPLKPLRETHAVYGFCSGSNNNPYTNMINMMAYITDNKTIITFMLVDINNISDILDLQQSIKNDERTPELIIKPKKSEYSDLFHYDFEIEIYDGYRE